MSFMALLPVFRERSRTVVRFLLCTLGLLGAGCIASLHYQPNDRIVETLGVDVARERLRETLFRAVSPPIQTMTLTNESLEYKWHPLVGTHINFVNLSRVEVFNNHTVFIRGASDQILSILRYGTEQDAKLFADLLIGFRQRYFQRREVLQAAVAPLPKDRHLQRTGTGSGFLINAQGEVLTNRHVVPDCDEVRIRLVTGENLPAVLIIQDRRNDLALLRLPIAPEPWLVFRDGRDVWQGEEVVAVGFPLAETLGSGAKVTSGIVSALTGMADDTHLLQITAPLQGGNSGGPLLDMSGNVVGVVVSTLSTPAVAEQINAIPQNINFAIKASVVRSFLDAAGAHYEARSSTQVFSTTQVSAQARQSTVFVECWE